MRKLFVLILVAGLVGLSSIANAYSFDFSSASPVDLTLFSSTQQGITFSYSGGSTAKIDTDGVTVGADDPSGSLILNFASPITNLQLGFVFLNSTFQVNASSIGTLSAILDPGSLQLPDAMSASGVNYGGLFETLTLFPNPDTGDQYYRVTSINYDNVSTVPEPSTMVLLTAGLFGLGMLRQARRKA